MGFIFYLSLTFTIRSIPVCKESAETVSLGQLLVDHDGSVLCPPPPRTFTDDLDDDKTEVNDTTQCKNRQAI